MRSTVLNANTSAGQQIGWVGENPSWEVENNSLKANEPVMWTSSRKYIQSSSISVLRST